MFLKFQSLKSLGNGSCKQNIICSDITMETRKIKEMESFLLSQLHKNRRSVQEALKNCSRPITVPPADYFEKRPGRLSMLLLGSLLMAQTGSKH